MNTAVKISDSRAKLEQVLANRVGRPRKAAPVTLPKLSSLDSASERVAVSRISLALQGDPMGLTTGEYRARDRHTIGDATPERFAHAKSAGVKLVREAETFEDGRETGLQRKRFISRLELWRSRDVIDATQLAAAQRFQAHHAMQFSVGPNMVSKYGEFLDPGKRELLPVEMQWHCATEARRVYSTVPSWLHDILGWIAQSAQDDAPLSDLTDLYYKKMGQKTSETKLLAMIQVVLCMLCDAYGMSHKWQERTRQVRAELEAYLGR